MKALLQILGMVLGAATPELRKMLVEWVAEFKEKAAKTPNPWDDMLAALLEALIGEKD